MYLGEQEAKHRLQGEAPAHLQRRQLRQQEDHRPPGVC